MATATTPVHTFETKDFALDSGVTLPLLKLAYQTFGQIDNLAKTILVSTCFGEGVGFFSPSNCNHIDVDIYLVILD